MTIAVGFQTKDGVVLCADMEESIGEIKTYDGKILTIVFHETKVVVAVVGSGYSDYIDTAKSYISDVFSENHDWETWKINLKKAMLSYFADHIAPWASFPAQDRPDLELLIAVTGKTIPPSLFYASGTAFYEPRHKAIGSGILLGQSLINRYWHRKIYTNEEAAALGSYILMKVKHGVQGCGGLTHAVGLRKGVDWSSLDKSDVEKAEKEFDQFENEETSRFIKFLEANPANLHWLSDYKNKK